MSVAEAASVRTVAVQLRSLSADEDNQPIIAREEGCMRALVSFIQGNDVEVAAIAVAAVKNLASHGDNFDLLRSEDELVDGLKDLLVSDDSDRDLRQDIFDILEELTDENNDEEMDELEELETSAGLKEKTSSSALDDDPNLLKEPVMARLHIPGISDEVFSVRVEQLVVRKRGVISIAFEMGAEVAVVYTRLPPEQLRTYVSTMTGTVAEILPEKEEEEEEEEKEESELSTGDGKENQPGYLDINSQRLRDVGKKKKNTISQGASSLHERLKKQREEESRRKARSNRLLDSIGRGVKSGWGMW